MYVCMCVCMYVFSYICMYVFMQYICICDCRYNGSMYEGTYKGMHVFTNMGT